MPIVSFSDTGLRSLKPPPKGTCDYWDKSLPCFGVRVSQGGTKTFVLNLDKVRRKIGRFPILSLADAREAARRIMAERTLGRVRPQAISYHTALSLFLDEKRKSRRARTAHDLGVRLMRHFPFKCQLGEITHSEVARRLSRIPTNSEHDHALAVAKTFFTWCHNRRYIDDNPVRGLSQRGTRSRTRVLSDEELAQIWTACEQTGEADESNSKRVGNNAPLIISPPRLPTNFATIVKLLILTGMRRGECAALKGEYVKGDLLILPGSATKNGREHTIPLTTLAKSLLTNSSDGYVFPARGRSTPFNGWSKGKRGIDSLSGVSGWTLHDIRRTAATRLAEMGIAPHVIERLLNHVSGQISGVAAVYNRASYIAEMRDALERWEAYLSNTVHSGARCGIENTPA